MEGNKNNDALKFVEFLFAKCVMQWQNFYWNLLLRFLYAVRMWSSICLFDDEKKASASAYENEMFVEFSIGNSPNKFIRWYFRLFQLREKNTAPFMCWGFRNGSKYDRINIQHKQYKISILKWNNVYFAYRYHQITNSTDFFYELNA